jgi:hypothetical protein
MAIQPKKFKQINEALKWACEAETTDELRDRVRSISRGNSILMRFIAWGVGYEKGITGLPEGQPPVKDEGLPVDMADSNITQEFRRLVQLLPDGAFQRVSSFRREEVWVQILQGIHQDERALLTAVKDVKLLDLYPKLADVLEDFLVGWKKPEVKKKTTSKKSEKQSVDG